MTNAAIQAQAIQIRRKRQKAKGIEKDLPWDDWLRAAYPKHIKADFAPHHVDLWEWLESIEEGKRPPPFCAFWPRGGAKSTSAEIGTIRVGHERKTRSYIWYISSTQDKADKHVESIAAMFEDIGADRAVSKYGHSKGWRRSRLRVASGMTVDALGLDVGTRGAKVEEKRPDMIILDDVDEDTDSIQTTLKKINIITKSILPAGSNDCAVLFIQNLIHPESIASRLSDGRADFLTDRILSGPHPAVENLTYKQEGGKFIITGGEATWQGQDLDVCQAQMNTWGLSSFLQEAQHEVERSGGIWTHLEYQHTKYDDLPAFVRTSVWVDPAVTSTDQSDSMGISAGGLGVDDNIYGLYFWEAITSPEDALKRAIRKAIELKSLVVGVETDQGGDTWQSVFYRAMDSVKDEYRKMIRKSLRLKLDGKSDNIEGVVEEELNKIQFPSFDYDKAGAGHGSKIHRNQQMLADYERGKVFHLSGAHAMIEKSLNRFPLKPLDLADSWYWTWCDLRGPAASDLIGFA